MYRNKLIQFSHFRVFQADPQSMSPFISKYENNLIILKNFGT